MTKNAWVMLTTFRRRRRPRIKGNFLLKAICFRVTTTYPVMNSMIRNTAKCKDWMIYFGVKLRFEAKAFAPGHTTRR